MDALTLNTREKIERLKAIRKRMGWSEETCAHHLGVTYSTLNRWERGESFPKSQVVLSAIGRFIARYGQVGGRP
jgi:transcriptional regulator with XRE-family HTH domain